MKYQQAIEKFELYILSLWLLFFLIIIITIDLPRCFGEQCEFIGWYSLFARNVVPLIAGAFVLAGVVYYLRFDHRLAGSKSIPVSISSVEDINYEQLTFLTTYIIPLISINLTSARYLIALAFLLVVIGIIYIKTDKFYANPTLAVLGFRLYSAEITKRTGERVKVVLITKDRLHDGSQIRFMELDEKVVYAKEV